MATYNTNSLPEPISPSTWDVNQDPDPNIGAQLFLGCTVASFNVSADIQSRGGQLNANLIEDVDPTSGARQKLQDPNIYDVATASNGSLPIVGSPQFFKLLDTSSNVLFKYNGILKSIGRQVSPNGGKTYNVSLSSPFSLLQNVTVILDKYAGFGFAQEGIPNINSINSYYQVGSVPHSYKLDHFDTSNCTVRDVGLDENLKGDVPPSTASTFTLEENEIPEQSAEVGISLSTNNRHIQWNNVYNILNVFGFYESESHGFASSKGYGHATSNQSGMKLSKVAEALHRLINLTSSSSAQRFFGGNLLSGTSTYNICAVKDGILDSNPYYYGFDVFGFIQQLKTVLTNRYTISGYTNPSDRADDRVDNFLVSQTSIDLGSLISNICSEFGIEFIVKLNEVSYTTGNETNYTEGPYYDGTSKIFELHRTSQGCTSTTTLGGVISVKLLDKSYVRCDRPFSSVAYNLLGLEIPDFGDYGDTTKNINPGLINPFSPAFDLTTTGPSYFDPLDDDFNKRQAEGSEPYGGKFPVETKLDSGGTALQTILNRAQSSNLSIVNTDGVTAKMVLGGPISRIVDVPRQYIYQYWGDINVFTSGNTNSDIKSIPERTYPVVTQILPHDDIYDHILIDMKDILPDNVCQGVAYSGIYSASLSEVRMAMANKESWIDFLKDIKPCKFASIRACADYNESGTMFSVGTTYAVSGASNDPQTPTIVTTDNTSKTTTYKKMTTDNGLNSPTNEKNTAIRDIAPKKDSDDDNFHTQLDKRTLIERIHQKVKTIGDTHYGKTWVAWMPHIETDLTDSGNGIIANYEKSWNINNNAYLEPTGYSIINAPISSKFIEDHRCSAYANYEYSLGSSETKFTDAFTEDADIEPFRRKVGNTSFYVYDFSEINPESLHISNLSEKGTAHTKIDVDEKYLYLPYDYFQNYIREDRPFIRIEDAAGSGSLFSQNSVRATGLINYESGVGDIYVNVPSKAGRTNSQKLANTYLYNSVIATGTHTETKLPIDITDITCDTPPNTGSYDYSWETIGKFLKTRYPDNGQDCFHFVKFETERVIHPLSKGKGFPYTDSRVVPDIYRKIEPTPGVGTPSRAILIARQKTRNSILSNETLKDAAFPVCIVPQRVGIPQQSNRYYYGPWFTDNKFIFAGRTEFLHDTSLVPESFLVPLYGSITSDVYEIFEQLSGTIGLNQAGQAFANSIDGFRLFANENGSVTIPGAPLISEIGDVFFSADPNDQTYILSISVQASTQGMTTTYNFGSNQPRLDDIPREYAKKIQEFSKKQNPRE